MMTKLAIGLIVVLVSVAVGRFTAPEKVRIETKIVQVDKKTEDKDIDKHEHKVTKTVTNKDGTTETTTVSDTDTGIADKKTDNSYSSKDTEKEVTRGSSKVSISALAGLDIHSPGTPVYGGAVSKSILGPIGVGAWGLTDGVFGASLSLTF